MRYNGVLIVDLLVVDGTRVHIQQGDDEWEHAEYCVCTRMYDARRGAHGAAGEVGVSGTTPRLLSGESFPYPFLLLPIVCILKQLYVHCEMFGRIYMRLLGGCKS